MIDPLPKIAALWTRVFWRKYETYWTKHSIVSGGVRSFSFI